MKYADQRNAPYTVVIGDREIESGELAFKNMATGQQENLQLNAIIDQLK
jgi:histidyl-tRNA synthetase